MISVTQLFRHPLKSHGREELGEVFLTAGQPVPWDRVWAIAHDRSKADGTKWVACANFSIGSKAPALMAINARWDETAQILTLSHPGRPDLAFNPDRDQDIFLKWVRPLVPENRALPARILRLSGRGFTDTPYPSVSLCNMASHRTVAAKAGASLSVQRWRGNIWFDAEDPWTEFEWLGKDVAIGGAVLRIRERIVRCRATMASPKTGERDIDTLKILNTWDHQDFGVYAEVIQSGPVAINDPVEVL